MALQGGVDLQLRSSALELCADKKKKMWIHIQLVIHKDGKQRNAFADPDISGYNTDILGLAQLYLYMTNSSSSCRFQCNLNYGVNKESSIYCNMLLFLLFP